MPLSIITINYNNADGLRKTLASVASQTYTEIEHIIIDGGSSDNSVEVIREYESSLALSPHRLIALPGLPEYTTNNAHMFYLVCNSLEERTALIKHLKDNGILAVFHNLSLHSSPYYQDKHDGRALPECDRYADCLVRLPMYYDLKDEEIVEICRILMAYFDSNTSMQ